MQKYWCLNWVYMLDESALAPSLGHLIEPKRSETRKFVDHIRSLMDDSVKLKERYMPAVVLKMMRFRTKFRTATVDKTGKLVDPRGKKPTAAEFMAMLNEHEELIRALGKSGKFRREVK